ncbi:MAG: nuclease-related domain-containing protein [Collinsella sp.]
MQNGVSRQVQLKREDLPRHRPSYCSRRRARTHGRPKLSRGGRGAEEIQLLSRWPNQGFAGERRVFYAIKHVGSSFEQLVNAELDYEGEHDEFDQILVSRQGLVIVEVKNYSSSAAIGSDGILRFEDGSGRMRNVGERMASKRYVLREIVSNAIGAISLMERSSPLSSTPTRRPLFVTILIESRFRARAASRVESRSC